ncbi:prenyltransferase/squalene oxidase repeat-containing protein [Sinosporangium siamense]|uniref:prenyltransferase/squalene oxidase repeat-containing protein n=1 Tax=Sinosporangium siamense TaxID=1367973 RepID=UPI0035EFE16C
MITRLADRPHGEVSASIYETARLVSFAPWLTGHDRRVRHVIDSQRADGGWGGPGDYSLVPTLSATEALLGLLDRSEDSDSLTPAIDRGLASAFRRLSDRPSPLPDTPGVELILLSLVTQVNEHLAALGEREVPGLDQWKGEARLPLPAGVAPETLDAVRARVSSGADLPDKFVHLLEVAGPSARRAPAVRPAATGSVGASPAATAAWLGKDGVAVPESPLRYLESTAADHSWLAPCTYPITTFERSWVLSGLSRAGLTYAAPASMVTEMSAALKPLGACTSSGLPMDADTTAVALYTLELLNAQVDPEVLRRYELPTHFCTWPGEEGESVSVNAHVLDVFGAHARRQSRSDHHMTRRKLSWWLLERQEPDGSWTDRWHTSPYYATASCALALDHYGIEAPAVRAAVGAAVRWTLDTQRPDGSWGRWYGTAEETAYALHTLLMTRPVTDHRWRGAVDVAVAQGTEFLLARTEAADWLENEPPLWVDKDLYLPAAIVRSSVVTAAHLAQVSSPFTAQHRAI